MFGLVEELPPGKSPVPNVGSFTVSADADVAASPAASVIAISLIKASLPNNKMAGEGIGASVANADAF